MIIPMEQVDSSFCDIMLATRESYAGNELTIINGNHAGDMPLHYVLSFPKGKPGWHSGLELRNLNEICQIPDYLNVPSTAITFIVEGMKHLSIFSVSNNFKSI